MTIPEFLAALNKGTGNTIPRLSLLVSDLEYADLVVGLGTQSERIARVKLSFTSNKVESVVMSHSAKIEHMRRIQRACPDLEVK